MKTVNFWGISAMELGVVLKILGSGKLVEVQGIVSSRNYIGRLANNLRSFLSPNDSCQQDEAPCHIARKIIEFVAENGVVDLLTVLTSK